MANTHLQARLRSLRRRAQGVGGAAAAGWGLAGAALVVVAAAWGDLVLDLSPTGRIGALAAALLAGVVLAILAGRRAWRETRPDALAKRLDQVSTAHGEIVAGVGLLDDPRPFTPLQTGLADIAVTRAAALARAVPDRRVVPARPALLAVLSLVLLLALTALVALAAPRMALALWLRFRDPLGDHPPYSAWVFRIEPGDVQVTYGQGVEVRATVEGPPVDRVELVLEPQDAAAERLPMFPEGEGRWRAAVADVTTPGRYFVQAARARSARHRIAVVTVPRLTGVRFRVTPPAYTRLAPYEGPLPPGGLAGLAGAQVEVWAASNRPLAGGTLTVRSARGRSEQALAVATRGAKEAHGAFTIRDDGALELRVRDVNGQRSADPFSASISLLHDERPFIRITEPRERSYATADVQLPVSIAAEDDYGITRVQLFRSLNDSRALPLDLNAGDPPLTRWTEQIYLPLAEYGLRAGDEIKLFARVEDNDPAGPKGLESPVVVVRIIARDVFERLVSAREGMEAVAAKYRAAERRLEALADEAVRLQEELEKLPPGSALTREQEAKLRALAERMREDAAAIRESAAQSQRYDIDKTLARELAALADALAALGRDAEGLAGRKGMSNGNAAKELAAVREKLGAGRKAFEENALAPIEHLARVYPLLADQARFVQLYQHQRDLAQRLASLEGRDGEDNPALKARMRDLEGEQRQLRAELDQLLDDIAEHTRLLPDDPRLAELRKTAEEFAAAVRASGASDAMAQAEEGLTAFRGTRAASEAKRAADILEQFLSQCSGVGAQCKDCALKFRPGLSNALGNSLDQMLADAGLSGSGAGAGSGYSAQQSTLDNVGLYGNLPTVASSARQGSGRTNAGAGAGRAFGTAGDHRAAELLSAPGNVKTAGQGQTPVPGRYQRRVADYFQRVADETGGR